MKARMIAIALACVAVGGALPAQAQTTWNSVTLNWTTPGDDSLSGTASQFDVRYSTSPITALNWGSASQSTGEPAPTASGNPQTFTVRNLARQVTYYFAMKVADDSANLSALSNVPSATTNDTLP